MTNLPWDDQSLPIYTKTPTEQEAFDHVAIHLRMQGAPATSGTTGNCLYRAENGFKCAAGWLIADTEYEDIMEERGFGHEARAWPPRLMPLSRFIRYLQDIHDTWALTPIGGKEEWIKDMQQFADGRNLDPSALTKPLPQT